MKEKCKSMECQGKEKGERPRYEGEVGEAGMCEGEDRGRKERMHRPLLGSLPCFFKLCILTTRCTVICLLFHRQHVLQDTPWD